MKKTGYNNSKYGAQFYKIDKTTNNYKIGYGKLRNPILQFNYINEIEYIKLTKYSFTNVDNNKQFSDLYNKLVNKRQEILKYDIKDRNIMRLYNKVKNSQLFDNISDNNFDINDNFSNKKTYGYLKGLELFKYFDIINSKSSIYNNKKYGFLNCELPGGFLKAAVDINDRKLIKNNDYISDEYNQNNGILIKNNNLVKYRFIGSSIVDNDYEYQEDWLMDCAYNGDMLDQYNINFLEEHYDSKFDLYTSDGSTRDISNSLKNTDLFYNSLYIGLVLLKNSGNFLIRLYPDINQKLLHVLKYIEELFDDLIISSSTITKYENFELYLIGKNFNNTKFNKQKLKNLLELSEEYSDGSEYSEVNIMNHTLYEYLNNYYQKKFIIIDQYLEIANKYKEHKKIILKRLLFPIKNYFKTNYENLYIN